MEDWKRIHESVIKCPLDCLPCDTAFLSFKSLSIFLAAYENQHNLKTKSLQSYERGLLYEVILRDHPRQPVVTQKPAGESVTGPHTRIQPEA